MKKKTKIILAKMVLGSDWRTEKLPCGCNVKARVSSKYVLGEYVHAKVCKKHKGKNFTVTVNNDNNYILDELNKICSGFYNKKEKKNEKN